MRTTTKMVAALVMSLATALSVAVVEGAAVNAAVAGPKPCC